MKTIIAGSRGIKNQQALLDAIAESGFIITEVISGCAQGVDSLAIEWAEDNNIKLTEIPAQWDVYGKRAGYLRNEEMAVHASSGPESGQLIAIWDGKSKGTQHMIVVAKAAGMKVFTKTVQ